MKAAAPVERAVLQAGPLSIDEVVARVRRPEAGAVAIFLGTVRDHNDGRAVVKLEYEAYPSMAVAEMGRIVAEIEREIPGVVLAVAHRTGSLAVGEVAVVCAASSVHRGEAQRACRDLIDRIKERVPIWKREHGPDGAYWVGWKDARCADPDHDHDLEPPPATSPSSPASKHRGHP
ncbi:MAG: molybdenum cofactor biosynthesis protein MoaE [Polyangiaceae bacterium]